MGNALFTEVSHRQRVTRGAFNGAWQRQRSLVALFVVGNQVMRAGLLRRDSLPTRSTGLWQALTSGRKPMPNKRGTLLCRLRNQ